MDTIKEVEEAQSTSARLPVSRRTLLSILGGGTLASVAGLLLPGCATLRLVASPKPRDVDILNFALNLEYLEAEFYTYAITGEGIEALGIPTGGVGTPGETTNGKKVNFADETLRAVAEELAFNEQQHVKFLREALGKEAVAKPAINLGALNMGFAGDTEFLILSRAFEDTGVSAYGGAAALIESREVLGAAARILAAEAYHAGNIRLMFAQKGITGVTPVDDRDILPPPSGPKFFFVDDQALSVIRIPDEVLSIVEPFFPNRVNGSVK